MRTKGCFVHSAITIALIILTGSVQSQTVTVDANNGMPNNATTFDSVQAAIRSFQASGGGGQGVNHGNPAPDVINVVAGPVVDEWIVADSEADTNANDDVMLDEALTIQGFGGNAVIALQMNDSSGFSSFRDSGFCWRQGVNLTLRNLVFIPSLTNGPSDDAVILRRSAAPVAVTITVDNVVITANDGSDTPVSTTGRESASEAEALLATSTGFGDDALWIYSDFADGSMTLSATDLVITAFNTTFTTGDRSSEFSSDGMIMGGAAVDSINCFVNLGEGCVISCTPRFGIQNTSGGHINIGGSDVRSVVLHDIHGPAVFNHSNSGVTTSSICTVNNCHILDCDGAGLQESESEGRGFIAGVENTIIANCGGPGILFFADGALPPGDLATNTVPIRNVTVHNCGTAWTEETPVAYDALAGGIFAPRYQGIRSMNRSVDIRDTIVSGDTSGLTGLWHSSDGEMSISHSALVTSGAHSLSTATGGTAEINVTASVISSSVVYANTTDPFSQCFFDVVVSPGDGSPYRTAGTDGQPLTGGGDLVEASPIITPISDYTIWEGIPHCGPQPLVTQGTAGFWSLTAAPTGMTVNSSTGVVVWEHPTTEGSPHAVTIRTSSCAGSDEESWLLTVTPRCASGDIDQDGVVSETDSDLLRDHLLAVNALDGSQEICAECNGQPGLDAGDLVWIVNQEHFEPPDMVSVPAGSLEMGDPWNEGYSPERPAHPVTLSVYEIGRHELTNTE